MKKKSYKEGINKIISKSKKLELWEHMYQMEKKIIDKLISTRKKQGLTQKELANKIGMKQSALARIETMANSPGLDTIIKIYSALDINLVASDCIDGIKEVEVIKPVYIGVNDPLQKSQNMYSSKGEINYGENTNNEFCAQSGKSFA